uniref:Uncharacterized protein n=1 Tax=Arundo donax TaxID=35708 RepID=A0A0A8ZD10_ARUDO
MHNAYVDPCYLFLCWRQYTCGKVKCIQLMTK